jgi:hypothetical protein
VLQFHPASLWFWNRPDFCIQFIELSAELPCICRPDRQAQYAGQSFAGVN